MSVEDAARATTEIDLCVECGDRFGFTCHRAQHVECDDVARTLPNRHHRLLAVAHRQGEVLGISVSAKAFQCLVGVVWTTLADPVLGDRRGETAEGALGVVGILVVCSCEAHRRDGCGLGLERQVGEHRCHGRLIGERCSECRAMTGVPGGLGDRLPHTRGAAEYAVESRLGDHLDDRAHSTSRLADHQCDCAVEFDLARRVGLVAELVLQPLDAEGVAGAVGQDSGEEEARESLSASTFRLCEDEKSVGHRCRAEPLVTGQQVLSARAARTDRPGDGGVGTDVGAALLLRHRHAEDRRLLIGRQFWRIAARQRFRHPLCRDVWLQFQRGDHRVRHRHRACVARLDLPEEHEDRRTGDV